MNTKVQHVDFSPFRRVIAVSDIHGDLDGFLGVLEQLHFTSEDALVIVGDILEKGKNSLPLLKIISRAYAQENNIFMVLGNNDTILMDWDRVPTEDFLWYIKHVPSVLSEMAEELSLPIKTAEDLQVLLASVEEHYASELRFVRNLPTILETPLATFVHAGIRTGPLEDQDPDYCLTVPTFAEKAPRFDKLVVVGHWPSCNYCRDIISMNPRMDTSRNLISIDGANSTKYDGQINYLLFSEGNMTFGYYDALPKIRALEDQASNQDFITLVFPETQLEVLEKNDTQSLCRFPGAGLELTIQNDTIYEYKGKLYCSDLTTYRLPIKKGDILSLSRCLSGGILVKKDGILGIYDGKYEFI